LAAGLGQALVEGYARNERMNQIVLAALDAAAWRAEPPGPRGRTIAAIFSHLHNIRRKWVRLRLRISLCPRRSTGPAARRSRPPKP